MKGYTDADITTLLDKIAFQPGDTLLVHSSLFNLGPYYAYPITEIPRRLITRLLDYTATGTLVMPSFSYDFPRTRNVDLNHMPSQTGVLTETFRQQFPQQRSGHPLFAMVAAGQAYEALLQPHQPEYDPFAPQTSVFGRLYQCNALILMLGVDLSVCTAMIYCERQLEVPYRFYKPFYGTVRLTNQTTHTHDFYHFCFPLDGSIREDYRRLQTELLAAGILKSQRLGAGYVYWLRIHDLFTAVKQALQADPWFLLQHQPEYQWGMQDGIETRLKRF